MLHIHRVTVHRRSKNVTDVTMWTHRVGSQLKSAQHLEVPTVYILPNFEFVPRSLICTLSISSWLISASSSYFISPLSKS